MEEMTISHHKDDEIKVSQKNSRLQNKKRFAVFIICTAVFLSLATPLAEHYEDSFDVIKQLPPHTSLFIPRIPHSNDQQTVPFTNMFSQLATDEGGSLLKQSQTEVLIAAAPVNPAFPDEWIVMMIIPHTKENAKYIAKIKRDFRKSTMTRGRFTFLFQKDLENEEKTLLFSGKKFSGISENDFQLSMNDSYVLVDQKLAAHLLYQWFPTANIPEPSDEHVFHLQPTSSEATIASDGISFAVRLPFQTLLNSLPDREALLSVFAKTSPSDQTLLHEITNKNILVTRKPEGTLLFLSPNQIPEQQLLDLGKAIASRLYPQTITAALPDGTKRTETVADPALFSWKQTQNIFQLFIQNKPSQFFITFQNDTVIVSDYVPNTNHEDIFLKNPCALSEASEKNQNDSLPQNVSLFVSKNWFQEVLPKNAAQKNSDAFVASLSQLFDPFSSLFITSAENSENVMCVVR